MGSEEVTKITDKYANILTTVEILIQEYMPSFKQMIGGSEYHLFNMENVLSEEEGTLKPN